jgi:hypothetical protein
MQTVLACLALVLWLLSPVAASAVQGSAIAPGDGRSRDTPITLGEPGLVGDYALKVVEVTPDATDIVMLENQFNDPPSPGNVFFLARIEATYTGVATGTPWVDLDFNVVGSSNRGYSESDFDCGVIPDEASNAPELFQGGVAQFNVCWSVPAAEASSLVMYVEEGFSFDDAMVWFSLNQDADVGAVEPAASASSTPMSTAPEAAPVQGPVIVGQTQVTWTGAWQHDRASSMATQVTLTQVDAASGTIMLATYGEFYDETVTSTSAALDTFAQSFFDGAGAQSVVWVGGGALPSGGIWTTYTFDLDGLQLSFLVTVSQSATGAYVVSTLTGNTESFTTTIELAQTEIMLNGALIYLDGVEPAVETGSST